ncbi:MAG: flagellar FliJ family protein [Planctomycetota bacterium]|jgi:flagellar FliJ protein|nr:flagellar FliJ family protein [Planctomycetota bacterium]
MARRFRFNLDPVLRYRKILEDQRRRDFAEANRAAEEERVHREDIGREREEVQDEIVRLYEEQAPFQVIRDSYYLSSQLEGEAAASLNRQRRLDQALDECRKHLVKARRDTQVMETLKDRRREEFVREQDRLDQALLDELSIQARGRMMREAADSGGKE